MNGALAISLALIALGLLTMYFGELVLVEENAAESTAVREPVVVTPPDARSLDTLIGELLASTMIPVQRTPGDAS